MEKRHVERHKEERLEVWKIGREGVTEEWLREVWKIDRQREIR